MSDCPRAVVLSGYYGFANVGDDALFMAFTTALVEAGCQRIVVPAGPHADQLPAPPQVEFTGRFDRPAIDAALRSGAALISGGGGLLQNATSGRSLAYYLFLLQMARRRRRPFAIAAQSIGPLHGLVPRWAVSRMLRHAAAISVRDGLSAERLAELGVSPEDVLVTADPAFSLPRPAHVERAGQSRIGVCLRATVATDNVVAAVREWLPNRPDQAELVWIPCHPDDEAVHTAVTESGEHRSAAGVEATMTAIAGCDLIVAERLHALVFAVCCGVPAVAVDYDPKVRGVALDCGLPIGGSDRSLSGSALTESVAATWARKTSLQADLERYAAAARQRVASDFRTLFGALAAHESGWYTA